MGTFQITETRISYLVDGKEVAFLRFAEDESTISILTTFVDDSLRGQGIASKLMEQIVNLSKEKGKKPVGICSYAASYLMKHQETK